MSETTAADVGASANDLLSTVFAVTFKVIVFLLIIAIGWIIAAGLHRYVARLLRRLGFDRAAARGALRRILGDTSASEVGSRLVTAGFLLLVVQLAVGVFGPNPVGDAIHSVLAWLPKLFAAVLIVVLATALASWVRDLITRTLGDAGYGRPAGLAAQVTIIGFGAIAAINQVGVAITVTLPVLIAALATLGGILVVGVGGGLIRPMQQRWERVLTRAEAEATLTAAQVRAGRGRDFVPASNDPSAVPQSPPTLNRVDDDDVDASIFRDE